MPKLIRSRHNLSHTRLHAFDMGQLVPVGCIEVLAGDTFIHSTSILMRVAPQVRPVMHQCDVRIHHFWVPNRILDPNWTTIWRDPSATNAPTLTFTAGVTNEALLQHFFACGSTNLVYQKYPVNAYNKIWNTFYRDEDIDTDRSLDDVTLARIRWGRDYFTAARTAPYNDTNVSIPVTAGTPDTVAVRDFRLAMAQYRLQEAAVKFGERYEDAIRRLGINPQMGMIDQPVYLGGGKASISFSEVLATAEGTSTDVGDMAGHGIGAMRSRRYGRFFGENGFVLSLASVRPKGTYGNVVPKWAFRSAYADWYRRELEIMKTAEVKVRELYSSHANSTDIFGWTGIYDEYRRIPDTVHGVFRTTHADWHMARLFTSSPSLNSTFVECTPTDRVYADTAESEVYMVVRHNISAKRMVRRRAQ